MASWNDLTAELDKWQKIGRPATFWWRDDDLNELTPAFDRLLSLRSQFDIPLTLAVIPNEVDPHIADELEGCHLIQHGVVHRSFAPEGEKKSEFPSNRDLEEALDNLGVGRHRMETLFEESFLPVFVPPWNRVSDKVVEALGDRGFIGLSRYKPRAQDKVSKGRVAEINTHVDPIYWRGHRSALSDEIVLDQIVDHLKGRRIGKYDPLEPTGILSHHLVHDEAIWKLLFKIFTALNRHAAVRWLTYPGAMSLIDDLPDD